VASGLGNREPTGKPPLDPRAVAAHRELSSSRSMASQAVSQRAAPA
jgi:hypothetical protein